MTIRARSGSRLGTEVEQVLLGQRHFNDFNTESSHHLSRTWEHLTNSWISATHTNHNRDSCSHHRIRIILIITKVKRGMSRGQTHTSFETQQFSWTEKNRKSVTVSNFLFGNVTVVQRWALVLHKNKVMFSCAFPTTKTCTIGQDGWCYTTVCPGLGEMLYK